ncbi:MAG: 1-acyl-sn-glycerol-3-phosphate acyltransferase [Bacteroidales bacterium]
MNNLNSGVDQNVALIDIEKIIRKQKSKLVKNLPGFIIRLIARIIHLDEVNETLKIIGSRKGIEFIKKHAEILNLTFLFKGLENVPDQGKFIFVCNHPLGSVDFYAALLSAHKKFKQVKVIANELLMSFENLRELFLPVNVFGKSPQKYHDLIHEAYMSEIQLMTFPAGEVSRKKRGIIKDGEWHRSFIRNSIQYQRDIIPVYIHGRNSGRFYFVGNLRKKLGIKLNLELFLLPDEMFRQKNKTIKIVIGKPISHKNFDGKKSHLEWAQEVKETVYLLENEMDRD